MKIFSRMWLLVVCVLVGCNATDPEAETIELKTEASKTENHFVLVQLPALPAVEGTTVALQLEGMEPKTKVFGSESAKKEDEAYQVRFEVGETVKPGTLTIEYPSGETRVLNQVVFDTLIRPPLPTELIPAEE